LKRLIIKDLIVIDKGIKLNNLTTPETRKVMDFIPFYFIFKSTKSRYDV